MNSLEVCDSATKLCVMEVEGLVLGFQGLVLSFQDGGSIGVGIGVRYDLSSLLRLLGDVVNVRNLLLLKALVGKSAWADVVSTHFERDWAPVIRVGLASGIAGTFHKKLPIEQLQCGGSCSLGLHVVRQGSVGVEPNVIVRVVSGKRMSKTLLCQEVV